jgi:electron transfer flavoprotein beta subunit
MRIVVCVRRVPHPGARVRLDAGGHLHDADLHAVRVMNPLDGVALEAGVQLARGCDQGVVTVLMLDGPDAEGELRRGLVMGGDRGVLLVGAVTMDGMATASALAAELRNQAPDLVLFGLRVADDGQEQVGPMVAELLGLPCVTGVRQLSLEGECLVLRRPVRGGLEVLEAELPAVVTVTAGGYVPRFPSLNEVAAVRAAPLVTKEARAP